METKLGQERAEAGQARNIARAVETKKEIQAGKPRQGDTQAGRQTGVETNKAGKPRQGDRCVLSEVNTLAARKSARFIFAYALANCLELHSKTQSLHVL